MIVAIILPLTLRTFRTAQTVLHLPLHVFRKRLLSQLWFGHATILGSERSFEHRTVDGGNRGINMS